MSNQPIPSDVRKIAAALSDNDNLFRAAEALATGPTGQDGTSSYPFYRRRTDTNHTRQECTTNLERINQIHDEDVTILGDTNQANIEGAVLLRNVEKFISRFVVLPPAALLPVSLLAIGTHCFGLFETFPYLALLSPEKGCGKTRTTEVLEQIVFEPVRAVCISEAALFRLAEDKKPTLILDEAEGLTGKGERAEAIRSLLNAGNRAGAQVPRCVGNSHELRFFSVFCPKIVCAIRSCPETVKDRAIVVPMQRKKPGEKVERFILRRIRPEGQHLREQIKAFTQANGRSIKHAYEQLEADFLTDRELENFEPLLAVLAVLDSSRLTELQGGAELLAEGKRDAAQDDSLTLRLLSDVRAVWPNGEAKIFTTELLDRLKAVEDGPWASDEKFDARKLSRFLRPFNVTPQTVQIGRDNKKGYYREHAEAAFERYLGARPSGSSESTLGW